MSIVLSALMLAAVPQTTAAERAGKFSLDLPADDSAAPPAVPKGDSVAPAPAAPPPDAVAPAAAPPEAPAKGIATHFSLDTPIADLIADPAAKAVLDKDMPGLSDDENLPRFRMLSLRRLAPLSGGQMTADLMQKLAFDLAALGGGTPPPPAKKRPGPTSGR